MAIDFLKGAAQGIAGRALRKVAGNLPGLLGINKGRGSNTSSTARFSNTKFKTKNYCFPLDVEGPLGTGNQGHYIMFEINQQTNSKLGFGNAAERNSDGTANMRTEAKARKIPDYLKELTAGQTFARKQNTGATSGQLISGGPPHLQRVQPEPKAKGSTVTIK